MGRKTWESIPLEMRPLPNRLNVILSTNSDYKPTHRPDLKDTPAPLVFNDLASAFEHLSTLTNVGEIFVVGGQGVFEKCLTEF
jgi:dihydrofolate reductase/thymidylate synthase